MIRTVYLIFTKDNTIVISKREYGNVGDNKYKIIPEPGLIINTGTVYILSFL